MFILPTTIKCWDTYPRQLSHIVTGLHWLLYSLILAASCQEEHTAFSSQAKPGTLTSGFRLECSPAPEGLLSDALLRRRDGEEQNGKQISDFADSPDAIGSFLLPSKRAEAVGRFWGTWALGFLVRSPAGAAPQSIFFLTHLICWPASKFTKIILSWQATYM